MTNTKSRTAWVLYHCVTCQLAGKRSSARLNFGTKFQNFGTDSLWHKSLYMVPNLSFLKWLLFGIEDDIQAYYQTANFNFNFYINFENFCGPLLPIIDSKLNSGMWFRVNNKRMTSQTWSIMFTCKQIITYRYITHVELGCRQRALIISKSYSRTLYLVSEFWILKNICCY